ncbi:hypothetical protein Nmel_016114 [Mimus melanotis]
MNSGLRKKNKKCWLALVTEPNVKGIVIKIPRTWCDNKLCEILKAVAVERSALCGRGADFKEQQSTLCGDVLLSTAFVSYLGYFTRKYRQDLLDGIWRPYLHQLKGISQMRDIPVSSPSCREDQDMAIYSSLGKMCCPCSVKFLHVHRKIPALQFCPWPQRRGEYGEELEQAELAASSPVGLEKLQVFFSFWTQALVLLAMPLS